MSGDGRVDINYVVERLEDVKTQTDLNEFVDELKSVRVSYDDQVARMPDYDVYAAIDDVKRDYINRALDAADGKFTKAADLLGLRNHQTFKNWYTRLNK
jgi:transcriptional regulator with GAF, ATPase, and Fis domain